MHRHGYQGKKLSLDRDQRRALIRGQVTSLVLHERITTTEAKAKAIAPYFERLVTKARRNDLHNSRQLRSFLLTENAVQKLISELVPAFEQRHGGYTRIVKAGPRRGDNAPMAVVSLVLPEKVAATQAAKTNASTSETTDTVPEPKAQQSKAKVSKTTSKTEQKS